MSVPFSDPVHSAAKSVQRRWIGLVALAVAALEGGSASAATNLVVNGDFSAGDSGFTTDYTPTTMTPYQFQNGVHGIYTVEAAASIAGSAAYGDWTNINTDPTGLNGDVFVTDAADTPGVTVWSETVSVKPGTNYAFSFYGTEVSNACCSNASLLSSINGVSGTALNTTASWQQSAPQIWASGLATMATLSLVDTNSSGPYNDFAVDDFSFTAQGVPEPATWALSIMGLGFAGGSLRRSRGTRVALSA